jgi:outer membrane protein TolC
MRLVASSLLFSSAIAFAQPKPGVLIFDAAVSRALAQNPAAAVAKEEITRALAIIEETRALSLPTLSANGTYTRLDHDRVLNGSVIAAANQVNANVLLTVPFVTPSRWVQWRHAKDNLDVARWSADDVKRQLALATARTYLALIAQHRVVEVSTRARDAAQAHYGFAHQRFQGGWGTRVDEVRASQEVASDESQLQAALAQLARLREALGVLVGENAAVDVTDDVTLPIPPPSDRLLEDATALRSDVRLLKTRLGAAAHVSHDSWADYAPSLVGTFQPFYQYPPSVQYPEWGWQAQLSLLFPIYDGGLRYGFGKERAALEAEARVSLEGGERQARSEVRAADEEVRLSTAALAAARDAARLAAEALSLVNLAYRAGASTNIEVIDAERRARDADTAVAQAEDAARQATLDLLIAGGHFP